MLLVGVMENILCMCCVKLIRPTKFTWQGLAKERGISHAYLVLLYTAVVRLWKGSSFQV